MSPEEASTKERILNTAVRLLVRPSHATLTTREIAREAGVNIAAIHYYFQTKENLIAQAYEAATEIGFAHVMQILRNKELPPRERLCGFLKGYAIGMVDYPGIAQAGFSGALFAEKPTAAFSSYLGKMLAALREVFVEMGLTDEPARAARALSALSSIILPFLLMGAFRGITGIDFGNRAERDAYIELLVKALSTNGKE